MGRQCIAQFLEAVEKEAEDIFWWNHRHARKTIKPLSTVQLHQHELATLCYLCGEPFSEMCPKIKEHCHLTGDYRGPACQPCNTKARLRRNVLSIIFHNFKGYDAHHIVREGVVARKHWNLTVIPTTSETYLTLCASWGEKEKRRKISFIDSLQFLPASLASLVERCPSLPLTDTLPWPSSITHTKGIFPYSYLNSEEKLVATNLPPIDSFYDPLNKSSLSELDYQKAEAAWSGMECRTFGDYMLSESHL